MAVLGRRSAIFSPELQRYICLDCRQLSTSSALASGHNRWSKIKHDKGKADSQKTKIRSLLAQEIVHASKCFGPDPKANPRLASAIANAKKADFPKQSIEGAIARGQGVSVSGAVLEPLVLEGIIAPSVAFIVDCQADNKARVLQQLRVVIKNHGAMSAPTSYLFQKKGRIILEKDERGADGILEEVIEAGGEDLEVDNGGNIVVYTDPSTTSSTANSITELTGLTTLSSDIIYFPNKDTAVYIDSEENVNGLDQFVSELQEDPSVQGVYINAMQGKVDDESWSQLQHKISV